MEAITKKVGSNIKKIRLSKNMSQGDISRKLNIDRGYISKIEKGEKNITIITIEKIARALNIPVEKLFY